MSNFAPKEPDIDVTSNGSHYILQEDYGVDAPSYAREWIAVLQSVHDDLNQDDIPTGPPPTTVQMFEENGTIIVPQSFQFDGASIPDWAAFIARLLTGFPYRKGDPRLITAALVHDWLYTNHQMKRRMADDLFFYMLCQDEVRRDHAWDIWDAVWKHGALSWTNTEEHLQHLVAVCEDRHNAGKNVAQYKFPPSVMARCVA